MFFWLSGKSFVAHEARGKDFRWETFSPDSLKIVDNLKSDVTTNNQEDRTVMFDQSFSTQRDVQVFSLHDISLANMGPLCVALQVETCFEQEVAAKKRGGHCENHEVGFFEKKNMRVVSKSKLLGSQGLRRKQTQWPHQQKAVNTGRWEE